MFYKEICKPRPSDYNRNGKLSYEAILQILENVAGNHSANMGDSIADANKNGIAWILTEWGVQIVHRPENGESLNITTWVRGKAPAIAVYRDFLLTDENGTEVIRAEAKFALFDLATSKLTRISEELLGSYQPEDKTVFEDVRRQNLPLKQNLNCAAAILILTVMFITPVMSIWLWRQYQKNCIPTIDLRNFILCIISPF